MEYGQFLSGQFLLAMPGMEDPRFAKSVVAMCGHDQLGAMGVCLHLVLPDMGVRDLMKQLDIEPGDLPDTPVHWGGPVDPQRGFVLHTQDWAGQDTRQVGDRWSLTTTRDVLLAIAQKRGPARWTVAVGYAGWVSGQLEEEMMGNSWLTTQGQETLIWETKAPARWKTAYEQAGINLSLLSTNTGRA